MSHETSEFNQITFFETEDCLMVPIKIDLYDDLLASLQNQLLNRLNNTNVLGVIIDISTISIIDGINLNSLLKLCRMTKLLGKETIIIGFQPGVAAALTELPNLELDKLHTFINLNAAVNYLKAKKLKMNEPTHTTSLENNNSVENDDAST